MRVGWIGLGVIGKPMALSVLGGGHSLQGYARRPDEHDEIRRAGGQVTAALTQTAAGAELVCVNLFSEDQVREVVIAGGALAAMQPGAILAIHSTVSPDFVRELALVRNDIHVLDAGFSGSAEDAAAGRLTLMVGGDEAILAKTRPVFETYAGYIVRVGPLGSGMALKVINNLMFAAHAAIARDALRLLKDSGIDLAVAAPTLARGSAGSNALGFLGQGGDPERVMAAIRPYLEKDVPIARHGCSGLDLGALDAATREFM